MLRRVSRKSLFKQGLFPHWHIKLFIIFAKSVVVACNRAISLKFLKLRDLVFHHWTANVGIDTFLLSRQKLPLKFAKLVCLVLNRLPKILGALFFLVGGLLPILRGL